tara:strand:- start:1738 stop:3006 length:1269 start_codon:yes stop_codon:yes gene_type:complete
MTAFILPDLGEGLKDADLVEWLVKVGQSIQLDELVLLVETAKAVVELPAPSAGIITRLAVAEGETVKVGQVLFEYEEMNIDNAESQDSADTQVKQQSSKQRESVSVVGELTQTKDVKANLYEVEDAIPSKTPLNITEPICINAFKESRIKGLKVDVKAPKATALLNVSPKIMAFAKKLGLQEMFDYPNFGEISLHDLLTIYQDKITKNSNSKPLTGGFIPLTSARKVMARIMTKSHQEIPSATIFEDADISHWCIQTDMTLKVIKAISIASNKVPIMNAWYDTETIAVHQHENVALGLAVNSERGLYVPVIANANLKTENEIRQEINTFRQQIEDQSIAAKDLMGATISLSNFGVLSGRYATPIIVPPQMCIIGIGKCREEALIKNGEIQIGKILPISISFDHRAATGAEAAQFMQYLIDAL